MFDVMITFTMPVLACHLRYLAGDMKHGPVFTGYSYTWASVSPRERAAMAGSCTVPDSGLHITM